MFINIIYFMSAILIPYAIEEFAYRKFIFTTNKHKGEDTRVESQQGYGWRIVWDAAYFFVLLAVAYKMIFSNTSFSDLEWVGYDGFLAGIGLRIWSLKELGGFYDPGIMIKTDHLMIATGPYRILRHPLHLGTLLKITGLAFFSPLWLAVPSVLVSFLLALYLNRTEDRIHAEQASIAFDAYYLSTWDIVDLIFWKNKTK